MPSDAGEMHVSGRNRGISEFDLASVFATDEERAALTMVRSLDLACNHLKEVRTLQPLVSLCTLDLTHNQIFSLSGLPLGLTRLHVAHNNLKSLDGIAALPNLQELDISHNRLQSLAGLSVASPLVVLKASHNRLAKVPHLDVLGRLRVLDLDSNYLASADALAFMESLHVLQTASFRGNPVTEMNDYRAVVRRVCPSLLSLDGVSTVGHEVEAPQETPVHRDPRRTSSAQRSSVAQQQQQQQQQQQRARPSVQQTPAATEARRSIMRSSLVERTLGDHHRAVPFADAPAARDTADSTASSLNSSALSSSVLEAKSDGRRRVLSAQVDQETRRAQALGVDLDVSQQENRKLRKDNASLQKQLSELRRVMSDELDEVASLRSDNQRLADELAQCKARLGKASRNARYTNESAKHAHQHAIDALERRSVQLEHENKQLLDELRLSRSRGAAVPAAIDEEVLPKQSSANSDDSPDDSGLEPAPTPPTADIASQLKLMMIEQMHKKEREDVAAEPAPMQQVDAQPAEPMTELQQPERSAERGDTAVRGVRELWEKHEAMITNSKRSFQTRSPYSPKGPR